MAEYSENSVRQKQNANLKSYPKGVSGNPKGKKKGTLAFRTIIQRVLAEMDVFVNGKKVDGKTAMVIQLAQKAIKEGDLKAMKLIMERLEGKPEQPLKIKDYRDDETLNALKSISSKLSDSTEKKNGNDQSSAGTSGNPETVQASVQE